MVLYLLWILTLTAPLIALTLTAGCAPLPRTASETSFVATANDATAAAVPPDVAGEFWKREHSREIQISQALRDVFERHLREDGLIVVPQTDVTASAGYANLKPRPSVSSPWAQCRARWAMTTHSPG